jgi:PadR family transcriptional regulator
LTAPKADLLKGTLDLLNLKALSLGPLHGRRVIQRVRQLSGEMLSVEQGSLYPALYRIEQRGSRPLQVGDQRDRPPGEVLHLDRGGPQAIDGRRGKPGSARPGGHETAIGDVRGGYEATRRSDR